MVRLLYGIVITSTLIICGSGCQSPAATDAAPIEQITPMADMQKQALLAQIEQKYESPAAHYQLGRIYHAEGRYDKAEFEYRVALGFDPANYLARAGIVKALADQGKQTASAQAAAQYISREADSPETALRLGLAFESIGLPQYALQSYQQAQMLAPNSAEVYRRLGMYYRARGDRILAEQNLRQSFQLDPYQPNVAAELGRMGVMVESPRPPEKNFLQKIFTKE
jgi:Flp pilus assembly protein TadD